MVIIKREERKKVFIYLLQNGVICFPKNTKDINPVLGLENLKLFMICKTLMSKGCVTQLFNWQYHYFTLTNDGISYIWSELGIEDESVLPITCRQRSDVEDHKKREQKEPREQRGPKKNNKKEEQVGEVKQEQEVTN